VTPVWLRAPKVAIEITGSEPALKPRSHVADPFDVPDLIVVPWKRFGHDRLYVNTAAGERVGWVDLTTSKVTLEQEHLRPQFDAALGQHGVDLAPNRTGTDAVAALPPAAFSNLPSVIEPQLSPAPIAVPDLPVNRSASGASTSSPAVAVAERPWVDLALNRPGQAIREQAISCRQAAPVRTLMARVAKVHTDERAFRIGADGEEKMGRQLARLPDSWRVLHSVPIGARGSDIDHVVIGPGGVFTINTKHHPDANVWVRGNTFKVNGTNQPYVRNSRFEAERAGAKLTKLTGLSVSVGGVIAVIGARGGFTVKAQPPDHAVFVLGRRDVVPWLLRHGAILLPEQVEAVFGWARRSTTWL
jgi:hypothetical protein